MSTKEPMTNIQLGEKLGISHSMASRVRNGRRLPGPKLMDKLASEFGIDRAKLTAAHKKGASAMGRLLKGHLPPQVLDSGSKLTKEEAARRKAKRDAEAKANGNTGAAKPKAKSKAKAKA